MGWIKYIISTVFVLTGFHEALSQNNNLIHFNSYSSPSLGYGDLNFFKTDSVFVYQFYAYGYDQYPVDFGLWEEQISDNIYETHGHKTFFLDFEWNLLMPFESASQVLGSAPIGWCDFTGVEARAVVGNSGWSAGFEDLPYVVFSDFDEVNQSNLLFEFNFEGWVKPQVFTDFESQIFTSYQHAFLRSLSISNFKFRNWTKLNESEVLLVTPVMGEQIINQEIQTNTSPSNLGYNWIKYNFDSDDFELQTVESENDLVAFHGVFPSSVENTYFGLKTLRGSDVIFDTSGEVYTNALSDSTYTTVFTKEDENGGLIWATELYSYNNLLSDSSSATSTGLSRSSVSTAEVDGYTLITENIEFRLDYGDTLYFRDFLGQSLLYAPDSSLVPCDTTTSSGYPTYGKSMLYSIDAISGEKVGQLEIDGHQSLFSQTLYQDCLNTTMHCQKPEVFHVGDSVAWVSDFYAPNDTVVSFISTSVNGSPTVFELALQAGYSSVILWVNPELEILDTWVIPATLIEGEFFEGIEISEIVGLGQDSILIAATIGSFLATNMDPSGQAENVEYLLERTAFLGVYGEQTIDGLRQTQKEPFAFRVFPNPANEAVSIGIDNFIGRAEFVLFDQLGRSLKTGYIDPSDHSFSISLDGIGSGMYLIQIQSEKYIGVEKFIVE